MFFFNPFWPLTALRIASLKATSSLLLILLVKSNLLRIKGGLIGGLIALTLISGLILSSTVASGAAYYIFRKKNENNDEVNFSEDGSINIEAVNNWVKYSDFLYTVATINKIKTFKSTP